MTFQLHHFYVERMLVLLRSGEIHIYLSGEDMQPLVIYRFF